MNQKKISLKNKLLLATLFVAIFTGLALLAMNLLNLDVRVQSLEGFRDKQNARFFALKKSLTGELPIENGMKILFRIHGSNTVGDELAPSLVSQYLLGLGATSDVEIYRNPRHPERIWVRAEFPDQSLPHAVEIYARGSSTGFKHLYKEMCQLAMSSRPLSLADVNLQTAKNVETEEHIIALDGIAVITHPGNPITELSQSELKGIFLGEIRNWKTLGGPNQEITVFTRDASSGTRKFFQNTALGGKTVFSGANQISSHKTMQERIYAVPGSIGFVSLPYIGPTRSIALKTDARSTGVLPSSFSISTEDYMLTRKLYMYANKLNVNLFAREFLEFTHGESGQAQVKNNGFVALGVQTQDSQSSSTMDVSELPADYRQLSQAATRLSINFRFVEESQNLNNRSIRDMVRLIRLLEKEKDSIEKLYLIGFSDNQGIQSEHLKSSGEKAEVIREMILGSTDALSAESVEAIAMGGMKPIAPNNTEQGRAKNRRVEVWILKK